LLEFGIPDVEERLKRYRRYVYEAGCLDSADSGTVPEEHAQLSQVNSTGQAGVIEKDIVEQERGKNYEISRQIGSGTVPDILRILGLLVLKNMFPAITSGLIICLCPSEKRFPGGLRVWMGFIR